MKFISTFFFTVLSAIGFSQDFFELSNTFFQQSVQDNKVLYQDVKSNPQELNQLISIIEQTDLESLNEPNRKAFLINSYNLIVIHQIVKNYPIKSVMEVAGFFDGTKYTVSGNKVTLNDIENKLIREKYNDPRVHFALVCGAVGCPPIIGEAYLPNTLNNQLERQTKITLNNNDFIQPQADGTVKLSEIFNWYREDFKAFGGALVYLNRYREKSVSEDQKESYYAYDWGLNVTAAVSANQQKPFDPSDVTVDGNSFNLQTFTAGSLLKKGQLDFTMFNSIYTESKNNWVGTNFDGYRMTFATSLIQTTYGISKNARFNIAMDIALRGAGRATTSESYNGIGRAFDFRNDDTTRAGVAFVAPKIRWQPFKNVNEFTLQSSYNIVFADYPEGFSNPNGTNEGNLEWIEWNRHAWWTQFFYAKTIWNNKFQVFAEADLLFRFRKSKTQVTHLDLPTSLFLSYFPTKKITFYTMAQHTPRFVQNTADPQINDWVIGANFSQAGLGFKYQFTSNFNIELLYSNFFYAQNAGLGETFNLGLKYILN